MTEWNESADKSISPLLPIEVGLIDLLTVHIEVYIREHLAKFATDPQITYY